MDREDKYYIDLGKLGCSEENESLNIHESYEDIEITEEDVEDYLENDRYASSCKRPNAEGAMIVLRDGSIYDISDYETHAMFAGACGANLGYDHNDFDNFDSDMLEYFQDELGIITLNSGDSEFEDRLKIVCGDKPTNSQLDVLKEFIDIMQTIFPSNTTLYVWVANHSQTYELGKYTSDELIKKIRMVFVRGRLEEKNYSQPNKLYNIDKDTAYWPEDAEDYIYWHSEADKWAEDYAKSYKVKMSPKEFLDLTTTNGANSLKAGDSLGLGKLRDLDVDEFNKELYQNMFLQIAFRDNTQPNVAQVVGHEGRHRMFALMQAGVKSVDVELIADVYDTDYDKYKPFNLTYIDLIGQFNKSVKVRVNNPIAMSWKQHKAIRPNLKDESLIEYLDTIRDEGSGTVYYDYPVYVTDEIYKLKSMLQRGDTSYRIYNLDETYYFQDATGNMTHFDMLQYAKDNGYISDDTRISSANNEYVFPEDSDIGYIVYIPKDFKGHLEYHTRVGSDGYYYCKVYSFGNLFVRDYEEFNDGLFKALGEADRTLYYDYDKGTVTVVDKDGVEKEFDIEDDLNGDPQEASTIDLDLKEDSGRDRIKEQIKFIDDINVNEFKVETLNEGVNKYYRIEIQDAFGDREGLFTGYFNLIPTKNTIEEYPEDFVDLTQEERDRYYRIDEIINELSKIKSPGVDTTFKGFKDSDIFAFTSSKYQEFKELIKELRVLVRQLNMDIIIKEIDVDDDNISYRDDDQIAFSKSSSEKLIDESMSRDDIEEIVMNKLGTSFEPIEGPSYIMRDGSFLKIWNSNKNIKGMSGSKSVSGKTMHLDVDGFINKEIDSDAYSYYYLNQDCIRVNTGFEEYIVLSKERPNNAQFDSLLKWLNYYFFDMKHDRLKVMDWYGSSLNSKEYYLDTTMPEEIIKKIKSYYTTGELRENKERFRVEWTTPEDSFEKSFSTYQKALDYYTNVRDGEIFWSTIEMYDTSKSPAELLAIDYKSNADIDKYLKEDKLSEYYDDVEVEYDDYSTYVFVTDEMYSVKQRFERESFRGAYAIKENIIGLSYIDSAIHDDIENAMMDKGYITEYPTTINRFLVFNKSEYKENYLDDEIDYYNVNLIQYEYEKYWLVWVQDGQYILENTELYKALGKPIKKLEYVKESLQEKIVKKGSKWQVQSEKGKNLGTYDTKGEAEKRLQQVHYFKHKNKIEEGRKSKEQLIRDSFESKNPGQGCIYITKEGTFINLYPEIDSHEDLCYWLEDEFDFELPYEDEEWAIRQFGWVRCRETPIDVNVIELPKEITQEQISAIDNWLNNVVSYNELEIGIVDNNQIQRYNLEEYSPNDILNRIKGFYSTGELVEHYSEHMNEDNSDKFKVVCFVNNYQYGESRFKKMREQFSYKEELLDDNHHVVFMEVDLDGFNFLKTILNSDKHDNVNKVKPFSELFWIENYKRRVSRNVDEDLTESIHLIDKENKNCYYTYSAYDVRNFIDDRLIHGAMSVIRVVYFPGSDGDSDIYCFCDAYNGIHETLETMAVDQELVSPIDVHERYLVYTNDEDDYDVIDYSDGIIYDYGDFRVFEVTSPLGKGKFTTTGLYNTLGQFKDKYRMINGYLNTKKMNEELSGQVYYHGSSQKIDRLNSPINWITEDKQYAEYYALALSDTAYVYICEAELDNIFDAGYTGNNVFALFPVVKPYKMSVEMKRVADKLNLTEEQTYKLIEDALDEYPQDNEYKTRISTIVRSEAFKKLLQSKGYTSIHTIEYNKPYGRYCDCYGILDSNDVKIISSEEVSRSAKLDDK